MLSTLCPVGLQSGQLISGLTESRQLKGDIYLSFSTIISLSFLLLLLWPLQASIKKKSSAKPRTVQASWKPSSSHCTLHHIHLNVINFMWVLGHENHRDSWKQSRGLMSPFVAYEEARFSSFSGLLNEALCAVPGMCCWGGMLGDTWGSAMGLRWKWVLLVTSTTGSCSWISKNICERQHRWELNWRRKHSHNRV